jgi:hypothetical protein
MEMKINDHEISKVCTELESEKYLGLASQSAGYAKLCCYAVKKLNENQIVTTYENICVALWLMFPKFEKFHLKGFDDMPDTDYMEKVIKLRSTPKEQDYLTGGNVGTRNKTLRSPWMLTRKGQLYANEAESVFSGRIAAPEQKITHDEPNDTINNTFRKIWDSTLFEQFCDDELPEEYRKLIAPQMENLLISSGSSSSQNCSNRVESQIFRNVLFMVSLGSS